MLRRIEAGQGLRRWRVLRIGLLAALALNGTASANSTTRRLAPGITYTQEITTGAAPLIVNVLRVDLSAPGVAVRCGQARDAITLYGPTLGRETVSGIATRNRALAAINADFFPFTGDPLGLAIRDGELLSEPTAYRACLGIGPQGAQMDVLVAVGALTVADGSLLPLDGINRVPHDGDTVVLTSTYDATPRVERPATVVTLRDVNLPVRVSQEIQGEVESVVTVQANQPLPCGHAGSVMIVGVGRPAAPLQRQCRPGDALHFRFDLATNSPAPERGRYPSRAGLLRGRPFQPLWMDVQQAVGGGPWLVKNGQVYLDYEAEEIPKASFVEARHPRTAVGVTADGNLLLVVVDGRNAWSRGASLNELAELMKRLGAVHAINLDGGGSSTMVVGDGVVNAPSDGWERPVANSLLVYGNAPDVLDADRVLVRPNTSDAIPLRAGESMTFALTDADGKLCGPDKPALWGTANGLGFISQQGVFTSYQAGNGTVVARIGARRMTIPVRVQSGPPAIIKAALGTVDNNPPDRNALTVAVRDRYGNPISGQRVRVEISGGQALGPLVTNADGQASCELVWDADPPQRTLTATLGALRSAPVKWKPLPAGGGTPPVPIDPDDRKP